MLLYVKTNHLLVQGGKLHLRYVLDIELQTSTKEAHTDRSSPVKARDDSLQQQAPEPKVTQKTEVMQNA